MNKLGFLVIAALIAVGTASLAGDGDEKRDEVVNKASTPAPSFTLTDIHGKKHSLADFKGKTVVLEWVNHGCPFVMKHYDAGNMQALQKKYAEKGVVWLSICSSAVGQQGYMEPGEWKEMNDKKKGLAKAVLIDADGKVGKLYGARTTPHMFVLSSKGEIAYQGALDDSPQSKNAEEIAKSRNFVVEALEAVLVGKSPTVTSTKPYGCSVKYAPEGNVAPKAPSPR